MSVLLQKRTRVTAMRRAGVGRPRPNVGRQKPARERRSLEGPARHSSVGSARKRPLNLGELMAVHRPLPTSKRPEFFHHECGDPSTVEESSSAKQLPAPTDHAPRPFQPVATSRPVQHVGIYSRYCGACARAIRFEMLERCQKRD
jgi:hypothetical protein